MPSAHCYLCIYKEPAPNYTVGSSYNPLGSCNNCSAFACDYHGYRLSIGSFECRLCDSSLPAASAAHLALESQSSVVGLSFEELDLRQEIIEALLILYHPNTIFFYVRNLRAFLELRPDINDDFGNFREKYEIQWKENPDSQKLRRVIESFPDDAQDLIYVAIVLYNQLQFTAPLPGILKRISNAIIFRRRNQ